jgi:hypothetical protein
MENVGIFYVHLEHFTNILWVFGNFKVIWYIFSPLWYIATIKTWQPCSQHFGGNTTLMSKAHH